VYNGWNYERYHIENERGVDLWRVNSNTDFSEETTHKTLTTNKPDVADADYTRLDTVRKTENNTSTPIIDTGKAVVIDHVLPSEPCHGCQNFAVETIITVPSQSRKLRFCKTCCDKLINRLGVQVIHREGGAT